MFNLLLWRKLSSKFHDYLFNAYLTATEHYEFILNITFTVKKKKKSSLNSLRETLHLKTFYRSPMYNTHIPSINKIGVTYWIQNKVHLFNKVLNNNKYSCVKNPCLPEFHRNHAM